MHEVQQAEQNSFGLVCSTKSAICSLTLFAPKRNIVDSFEWENWQRTFLGSPDAFSFLVAHSIVLERVAWALKLSDSWQASCEAQPHDVPLLKKFQEAVMITLSWSFLVEGFDCCYKIGCWTCRDPTKLDKFHIGHFKERTTIDFLGTQLFSMKGTDDWLCPTNNFIDRPTFDWLLFAFCECEYEKKEL